MHILSFCISWDATCSFCVHVVIGHESLRPWWQVCWKWPEGKFWHLAYHIGLKIHPQYKFIGYMEKTIIKFLHVLVFWPFYLLQNNMCEVESNFFWRLVCKQACRFTQGQEFGYVSLFGKEWRRFEGASTKLMYSLSPTKLKLIT